VATAQTVAEQRGRQRLAATEQERARWARELHDQTLQGLGALRVRLSSARRSGQRGAVDEAVEWALEHVDVEIAGLRALITDLRPPALDELGAAAAIEALADRVAGRGLHVDVDVRLAYERGETATRHIPELETTLYRLAQEALTNAARHGEATRASVEIHEDDSTVRLTVVDDGRGFDVGTATEGFGLVGMRERVELLGGALTVESSPGQGTTIHAALPSQRRAPGAQVA
jgi:signal transduction histidine kinase